MKIKVVLRDCKIYKNGQSPLMVRFTHERTVKFVSLGLSVESVYWDKEAEMLTANCPNRAKIQRSIDDVVVGYHKKIQRLEALDMPVNFDTLLDAKPMHSVGMTIAEGFKEEIERLESLGKINSANKHRYALQVLAGYKPTSMQLSAIDMEYLKGLELYLRQRGNKDNSIATRFAIFKAIYNKAIKENRISVKQNPFSVYQVGSLWSATRKRAINKQDIQHLAKLDIPHNRAHEYKRLARDLFLFSYYSAGMNFGDIARLHYMDIVNGRVYYTRHKTQKLISFQLIDKALEIIEKYSRPQQSQEDYIFPILDKTLHRTPQQIFNRLHKVLQKINRELKALGDEIGLAIPLTTYVARHTYATVLKRSGVSVALISESLGHSDISTTQIYLDSFENTQIDAAMQNLL